MRFGKYRGMGLADPRAIVNKKAKQAHEKIIKKGLPYLDALGNPDIVASFQKDFAWAEQHRKEGRNLNHAVLATVV